MLRRRHLLLFGRRLLRQRYQHVVLHRRQGLRLTISDLRVKWRSAPLQREESAPDANAPPNKRSGTLPAVHWARDATPMLYLARVQPRSRLSTVHLGEMFRKRPSSGRARDQRDQRESSGRRGWLGRRFRDG